MIGTRLIGARLRGIGASATGLLALAVLTATAGWLARASSMIASGAGPAGDLSSSLAARETLLPDGRVLSIDAVGRQAVLSDGATRRVVALPEVRRQGSVTVMPGGEVLLWGGTDAGGQVLATGEWFDPATAHFVRTGVLGLPARAGHTLTVLTDGQLLLAGGESATGAPAREAVVWQPASHTITARLPLPDGPRFHARAELQPDGAVRLSGGADSEGRALTSAWRFAPGASRFERAAAPTVARSVAAVIFPAADSTSAPIQGPLALRFATPVDVRQLTRATVTLLGPEGVVPIRVVGAEGGRLAFVQLPDELYPGSRYTLFVKGLHTASGAAVPYTARGFTTARVLAQSVVMAGQGHRRSPAPAADSATPAASEPPLYLMAGDGTATCGSRQSDQLCRTHSFIKDGAWYPGQNNAPDRTGAHWRVYQPYQRLPDTRALEAGLPKGSAALIGQVRQIDETPVANVEVSIGDNKVRTDARGVFVLTGLSPGRQAVFVDGGSASHDAVHYGRFLVGADVKAKTVTHLPFVMYLPRVLSPTTRETVLTHPDMPGLELHVPAGAVFKDRDGHVLSHIAIVPTPVDHAPFPLPDNFPMYFTIQPGDAVLTGLTPEAAKGMRVVYPNYGQAVANTSAVFWTYSVKDSWQMYGTGHVTANAQHLAPDPGVTLVWALGAGASFNNANPSTIQKVANCSKGAPIDLQTGILFHQWNDLSIHDVLPLTLTRGYTSADSQSHLFGIGGNANVGMHLNGTTSNSGYTFATPELILPCGEGIAFNLVGGSATWPFPAGTVWQHTGSASGFYGATLQFLYDTTADGAHWIVTLKDGTVYAFTRHVPNALAWVQDRFGNQIQYHYNGGLMDQMISPSGRSITLNYDSGNRVASAVDNSGRTVSYAYDSAGTLGTVTYPDATTEQYTYNAAHSLLTMQDRRGTVWVTNHYDANGRIDKQTYADNTSYQFAYTTTGGSSSGGGGTSCGTPNQPPCIIATLAQPARAVAAASTPVAVFVPPSGTVPPGGDPSSVVTATTVTDPNGNQEHVTFDPASFYPATDTVGYGTSLAQTTTTVRQASGLVTSQTDSLGRQTTYAYDAYGNVTQVTRLAGTSSAVTTQLTYTPDYSQLASITDPLGHTTTLSYVSGCLSKITDPLGHSTTIQCNAAGQPTSVKDALGHITALAYQGYDLQSVTDALNRTTQLTTDALGRTVAARDPLGNVGLMQYDVEDRVTQVTDALNQTTAVSYDGNGNPLSVTLPSKAVISTTYDARNRPVTRTDALNQRESWTYDGMNDVLSHMDRKNQATVYRYDALNRRSLVSYADGSTTQASYDAANRLTGLLDSGSGQLSWTYDGLDRTTSAVTPQATISYGYDAADRRISMTPAAQAAVSYVYDSDNRLTSLTQGSETVQLNYDAANRRSSLILPNGISMVYGYDAANELTGINYLNPSNTSMGSLTYGYDLDGRRISKTGSFATDVLPATTSAPGTFDLNNRQTSFNGTTPSYDANGNLTSNGIDTFVWNARNQLTQITEGGNAKFSYAYDALGRRTSKSVVGATAMLRT